MSEANRPLIRSQQHGSPRAPAADTTRAQVSTVEHQVNDGRSSSPNQDQDSIFEYDYNRDDVEVDMEESGLGRPTLFVWVLALVAGISGLLFGYDTGVISSTLVSVHSDLSGRPLTTLDKSLVTSCTALFALVSSPLTGVLADKMGRKKVILVADGLFVAGALCQAQTGTVWGMIGGRSVVGLAVGGASLVVPMYISELSPSPFRGQLVTLSILFITLGQVIAYVIGYLFSSQPHGWRWMVGLGALPAAVQAILLFPLPESPRWLVKADKTDAARMVLDRVFGKGQEAQRISDRVLRGIAVEIQEEEAWRMRQRIHQAPTKYYTSWLVWIDQGWTELFRVPGNRRALAIACVLQALQQLCGFNSLMYFAATIFSFVGFTSPTLTALSIASTNFIFTLLALLLIDRVGRRKILLYSIPPMAVGLCLCAFAFFFIHIPDPTESVHASDENGNIAQSRTAALTVLVSLILYVAGYALGLGNVPWQQSELFPLSVRSIGSSISTSTNWGSNFIVGLTFLPMLEFLTPMVTFTTYAGVCIAGWLLIRRIYPETKGMSLEEVGGMLAEGWGVDESLRRVGSR